MAIVQYTPLIHWQYSIQHPPSVQEDVGEEDGEKDPLWNFNLSDPYMCALPPFGTPDVFRFAELLSDRFIRKLLDESNLEAAELVGGACLSLCPNSDDALPVDDSKLQGKVIYRCLLRYPYPWSIFFFGGGNSGSMDHPKIGPRMGVWLGESVRSPTL